MPSDINNFTIQEINTLLEALRAWQKQPATDGMLGTFVELMTSGRASRDEQAARRTCHEKAEKAEREVVVRTEASILLQAKLLMMRNEATSREFTSEGSK